MKILVSGSSFGSGGAERVMATLSYELPNHFSSVVFVLWKKRVFYSWDKRCRIIWLDEEVCRSGELRRMIGFRKVVKREQPDIILSFLEPFNIRVLLATRGLGIRTIVAERNDPRGVNNSWLMRYFEKCVYKSADGILVQTQTICNYFDGPLKQKTKIIFNPVSIDPLLVGKALDTRKEDRIVCVARLQPQKRYDDLINAFKLFQKTHHNYSLSIYGEGPCQKEIQDQINVLGLTGAVTLHGNSINVHQSILSAKIFVLVSEREGMSNSMIEAMCLGLPPICTKVSGALELIQDGFNGFLVNVGDIDGIAERMTRIADNEEDAYVMGQRASLIYEELRKEKIVLEWTNYLNTMVQKS